MSRLVAFALVATLVTTPLSAAVGDSSVDGPKPTAATGRTITVTGTGITMYPSFRPTIKRYALASSEDSDGVVTVHASTDGSGTVHINGRPEPDGTRTLAGLRAGDEIAVFIRDSSGWAAYSLIYLPAGFPELEVVTKRPGVAPGVVGLTLSQWVVPGSPNFETAIDRNGVPVYVRAAHSPVLDLKRQPNGYYSVSRRTTTPGRTGLAVVELDSRFRTVASYETVGLVNTDGHDSILLPDGSRYLVGYEPDSVTGRVDAVIQQVDANGTVDFEWNSRDHVDPETESVVDAADYAHINSIAVMANGDILASFRHLSAIMRIARTARDGVAIGDVIWRLGGRMSDFAFVDDPYGGPCAQHSVTPLPNGNILVFDNGSWEQSGALCVNPADPAGPTIERPQTRITEYAIAEDSRTATLVWSYQVPDRFAIFAGSAQRLGNGNTLVGWAAAKAAVATEVDAAGEALWEIKDTAFPEQPDGRQVYFTYRAAKFAAPDATAPRVTVTQPSVGATYPFGELVRARFGCTDRGGSNLRTCRGSVRYGAPLDTSAPGEHTIRVSATDGAGNTRTVTRRYTVATPKHLPDAVIRRGSGDVWVGDGKYGSYRQQLIRQRIRRPLGTATAVVAVQNDGSRAGRMRVEGRPGSRRFSVVYRVHGHDVTGRVVSGSYLTPTLQPGENLRLRISVIRTKRAHTGDQRTIWLRAASRRAPSMTDAVATLVTAARRNRS